MKKWPFIVFALVAAAQLAVPASMIVNRARTLRVGRVWKLRTAPVDPVDAVRGRYLALRYAAESFPRQSAIDPGQSVCVHLKEDADGFAIVDRADASPPAGDDAFQVERLGFYEGAQHVRFPFDRLWLTEDDAQAADAAYAEHSKAKSADAYAVVRVHRGDAGIEELFIAGKPLREFLRAGH